MIRKLYRTVVPEFLRRPIWHFRNSIRKGVHELRWKIASPRYVSCWTDKRLQLGDYFWVFILGCNNSGTTLLMRILERHPSIRSLPMEGQMVTKAIPSSPHLGIGGVFTWEYDLFRWTEESDACSVARLKYDWAAKYSGKPPGILLEKSPPNTLRSRWLQKHFRPSRFIVLTRNPYASCEGNRRRRGHSLEEAAEHWRLVHETLHEDLQYLDEYLWITYEDLTSVSNETFKRVQEFLGLKIPFDEILNGTFSVHSMDGMKPRNIQDFNARSFARLSAEDFETITRITNKAMRLFSYEPMMKPP